MSNAWSAFVDSYLSLRDVVFSFASGLVDLFQTRIGDIIDASPSWLTDVIGLLLPESLQQLTLLSFLTASIVPTFLVIFIVRMFVKN